jgi:NADH-quinone oxidoreductase subunit J
MLGSDLLFYALASISIISSIMVVQARFPVRSVFFLILTFISSAMIWITLGAEFLSLLLIFVYVGAVMTLFLFVIMMLNITEIPRNKIQSILFWPAAFAFAAVLLSLLLRSISHFQIFETLKHSNIIASNTEALGMVLYTNFALPFEMAAIILLVAMVSAVCLTYIPKKKSQKSQKKLQQHQTTKQDRLTVVDLKGGTL